MTETCLPIVNWLKNWFTSTDDLIDKTYPIGSIYMSVNNTSPSTLFGGTWVQLTDTFLYATSTTADANSTTAPSGQGSKDAVVVAHTHTQNAHHHSFNNNTKAITVGSAQDWKLSSARKMSYTSGSSYYPYTESNSGGVGEVSTTENATATNQSTGVSGTDKNMPPYMKVYMWKRTA